jgi:hypothetical protein
MIRLIILSLCLLLVGPAQAARGILGAQSYDSPLGCAPDSTFNLVAGTTLNTFASASGASSAHEFKLIPDYNNGQGASYQVMLNGVGNLVVATAGLQPSSYFGSLQYSTANNPDVTNTIGTVAITSLERLFIHGTRVTAPCAATNCLHNWLFDTTGAGPGINTDFTIGSANAGQGTMGGVQSSTDGTVFFLHRLVTPVNTTMLWQFDQNVTTTLAFVNVGNVTTREMTQDTGHVYFTNAATNQIIRATKDGMVLTTFNITPTSLQDNLVYSTSQNSFYLATVAGGPILTIRQYNTDFSSNLNNLVIGNETLTPFGILMDNTALKLYIVTEVPGFKRIRRVNPGTLAVEQTLSIATGTSGFVSASDFTHRNLWISDMGNPSHIQRIQLCT